MEVSGWELMWGIEWDLKILMGVWRNIIGAPKSFDGFFFWRNIIGINPQFFMDLLRMLHWGLKILMCLWRIQNWSLKILMGLWKNWGPLWDWFIFFVIGSHQIPMPSLIGIEIELWLSRLLYGVLLSILSLGWRISILGWLCFHPLNAFV